MVIKLNNEGYEPFFDFIKAYAIICVLVGHTVPGLDSWGYLLWAGMQVPMFVLVQSFHALKKKKATLNFPKLFKRILSPFIVVTAIYLAVEAIRGNVCIDLIKNGIVNGGYGPGSYFPILYIQIAVFLYVVRPLFKFEPTWKTSIVMILICEIIEITESIFGVPEWIHRLLCVRYFFCIYLAWIWVRRGIVINVWTVIFSLVSLACIVYFQYFSENDEPWFFLTNWKCHRWPCYYYVSTMLCGFLYYVYQVFRYNRLFILCYTYLSRYFYEIFLVQMVAIAICPSFELNILPIIDCILWIIFITSLSIVCGRLLNRLMKQINSVL